MNTIQNYGMTNYQMNFQARTIKKPVKTLADVVKKQKPLSKEEQKLHEIRNLSKKMNFKPNCYEDENMVIGEFLDPIERSERIRFNEIF